mmetsp:Transcript_24106/g.77588  ORF Transcript_24106/g.77588 Transcript_24106/m.77588 type:complete len:279 (-) Transcript_24106:975-1811(-)
MLVFQRGLRDERAQVARLGLRDELAQVARLGLQTLDVAVRRPQQGVLRGQGGLQIAEGLAHGLRNGVAHGGLHPQDLRLDLRELALAHGLRNGVAHGGLHPQELRLDLRELALHHRRRDLQALRGLNEQRLATGVCLRRLGLQARDLAEEGIQPQVHALLQRRGFALRVAARLALFHEQLAHRLQAVLGRLDARSVGDDLRRVGIERALDGLLDGTQAVEQRDDVLLIQLMYELRVRAGEVPQVLGVLGLLVGACAERLLEALQSLQDSTLEFAQLRL